MPGELDWATDGLTWRASPLARSGKMAALAAALVFPELLLWLILYVARVPYAGWVALACALMTWMWLARRTWTQAVTLTRDFVVLGKVITGNERIALASITAVSFRQGMLTITARGSRYKVTALPLGASYLSGRRRGVDDVADDIAAAAGLPALPQRRRIISLGTSLALIPLTVAVVALGRELEVSHPTQVSGEIGALLLGMSPALLGVAIGVTFDHVRGMLTR